MYRISKRKSLLALASLVFAVMAVGEIAMAAKYDYKAMGIEHRIYEETGIELFEDYRKRRCILANKEDHCLPSGYVQAVELGAFTCGCGRSRSCSCKSATKKPTEF